MCDRTCDFRNLWPCTAYICSICGKNLSPIDSALLHSPCLLILIAKLFLRAKRRSGNFLASGLRIMETWEDLRRTTEPRPQITKSPRHRHIAVQFLRALIPAAEISQLFTSSTYTFATNTSSIDTPRNRKLRLAQPSLRYRRAVKPPCRGDMFHKFVYRSIHPTKLKSQAFPSWPFASSSTKKNYCSTEIIFIIR